MIYFLLKDFQSWYNLYHAFTHTILIPCQLKRNKAVSWGKNISKKTPRDDYELGYIKFTLSLTTHLTQSINNKVEFSPTQKKNLKCNGFGWSKLWRIVPMSYQQAGGSDFPDSATTTPGSLSVVLLINSYHTIIGAHTISRSNQNLNQ